MNNSQELSTFSHEINNSLTLIYGQIQYIEKTNDILTQNEHWNRMKDDFSSLFDFIHQFLAPEDTTSATIEPLDLINLISELRSSWSYYLHKERIRFFIQADPGTAFYVYGAKSKLFQLFHNLISNAVKAIQQKEEIIEEKGCEALTAVVDAQILLYEIDTLRTPTSIEQLIAGGYLKESQKRCPDGRSIVIVDGQAYAR